MAQSTTAYDETSYPLFTYSSVTGWTDPATAARGNATTSSQWLNTTGTWLATHAQYDQLGNVRVAWDAKGNQTQLSYTDAFSDSINRNTYALATLVTSPIPDPTGVTGSATAFTTSTVFDFSTSAVISATDINNKTASFEYNDLLDRPTKLRRAIGTLAESQTSVSYDDVAHIITTSSDLNANNDNTLVSKTVYDGLGRTIETRQYEGGTNYIAVQTQYDALGRAYLKSNPFRPWQSETAVWTTTGFDALGRVISVTTPDSAVVSTSYSGNTVTVTDQAGKKRKSVTDGLGRLKEVYEDPAVLNYLTSYSYDALDDLITVSQGGQTRSFIYDSLKRLTSATNPESGTINYTYDNNGNLASKTDARSITTTYGYDAINRNTTIDYSDTTGINPDVTRGYDGATNGKGRFWYSYAGGNYSTGNTVEHTAIDSYDALGKPLIQRQLFKLNGTWGPTYQTQLEYNLAGAISSETYPSSSHGVSYSYDSAGRLSSFTGNLGDGVSRTYATGVSYSKFGGITEEQFGTDTPLYHKLHYNSRGQLYDIRASTVPWATDPLNWNRGCLEAFYDSGYHWGGLGGLDSGPDNNGNMLRLNHWRPDNDQISSYTLSEDTYTYDALNRISSVSENSYINQQGPNPQFVQSYTYDRWGNRTINAGSTWGTGVNNQQFTVNTANNRLGVPSGQSGAMSYDNAGNLNNDTYSGAGTRTYDAENRMTQAWGGNNQWQVYTYNADGDRVRRKVDGVETWQVYGPGGELLAEYAANAAASSPQKEYGYRNGQLLVTLSITAGSGGNPFTFAEDPLAAGTTTVKAVHLTELRTAVDQARAHAGLSAASWAESITTGVTIKASHITELRARLDEARVALSLAAATYTDPNLTANYQIKAAHIQELRTRTNETLTAGGSGGIDIRWLVGDQLGTPRMIFDKSGSLVNTKRHDYLPFGEELYAGAGGRTSGQGYAGDSIRQKFTQKERDIETGLDYFGERYYASSQGRFTSVDPLMASATTHDPQSFNRYTFVLNNPLRYVDPDGMDAWDLLTKKERKIITPKIAVPKGQTARQAFNNLATVKDAKGRIDKQATADKVTTVKNFIDSAGGHSNSEVWQQIKTVNSIDIGRNASDPSKPEGRVTVSVADKNKFLEVAGRNGYDVNRYYEVFSDHQNDSVRQITRTSFEPGMHFANDDPSNLNKFYVHWDRRSTAFREGSDQYYTTWGEQQDAASTHNNPYTPGQLRQELKKNGTVPRGEP